MSRPLDTEAITRALLAGEKPRSRGRQSRTENLRRASKRHLAVVGAEFSETYVRPKTFEECQGVGLGSLVPCPFVGCTHHLYLDVDDRFGPSLSVKLNFPDQEPDELEETCARVVAERGEHTLVEVAALLNVTRERVRQIERSALNALAESRRLRSLAGAVGTHEHAEPDDGSGAASDAEAIGGLEDFAHHRPWGER